MARASKPDDVPQKTVDHFDRIPWCAKQLDDPAFRLMSMSRTVTHRGSGHTLMAETWNTEKTITELLSMYRPSDLQKGQTAEVRRFYTFGSGLNAHPNLLHGGVIAAILDSTMGNVIGHDLRPAGSMFTVALNITYKKPVRTPDTVLARSWITKIEPRKVWVGGALESGTGDVHAVAEGMWLLAKGRL